MKELKRLTRNNIANVVRDGNLTVINAIKSICNYRLTKNSGDCYADTLINLEGEWYIGNIGDLLENHPRIKHDNPY